LKSASVRTGKHGNSSAQLRRTSEAALGPAQGPFLFGDSQIQNWPLI
jgi:hypothetical protein